MFKKTNSFRFTRTAIACLLISILILSVNCARKDKYQLTLLHTNDMHAHFTPEPAFWLDDKPLVGGFVALDYYIQKERSSSTPSLLFDAGDLMTGNPISDIEYNGTEGGALIAMMNEIGYDGMVIGNHEFDKPADNIRALVKMAEFPVVCANLSDPSGKSFLDEPYHIYNVDGCRVGVIGVTYHQMLGMATADNLDGFDSLDPVATVTELVKEIDPKTDLIIVLSHLGYDSDVDLAEQISGVDIIIGGHTHKRIENPEKVNGIIIAQAGSYTRQLGKINITVAGDTIQDYSGSLITTLVDSITPNPKVASIADSIQGIIEKEYGKVIGELNVDWAPTYRAESNVGNYLTDAIREKTGADIALINSGGIRKRMSKGPITLKDIAEMLPFENYIQTFKCTGKDLMNIIRENADAQANETHGILQVSGVKYSWKKTDDAVKVYGVFVGAKKLKPEKTYVIASIDYVIGNHERYFKMVPENPEGSILLSDLIIEAISEKGDITSRVEGRINGQ